MPPLKNTLIAATVALALAAGGWSWWRQQQATEANAGFAHSNGRIEATEVDVATKLAGRVRDILVDEGTQVHAGQVLATMQVATLDAQLREAQAQRQQSLTAVAQAQAQVAMRESDRAAAVAQLRRTEADLQAVKRRLARSETLAQSGATSLQTLDDDRAQATSASAAIDVARAQLNSAGAAITAARAQVTSAQSQVEAMDATLQRIQAEIDDSQLKAPRDGRVQFRVAQPGEVLGAGGKVLNLIDLSEVYMTFFLPTEAAGQLAIGAEARLVLDAAPGFVIPARISYIASTAQFTPKTVETASERQKLMFRVRAQVDRALLREHLDHVKTGLPGEAWVRLDAQRPWPAHLALKAAKAQP